MGVVGWQWGQMCEEQMLMPAWEPLVLGPPSDKPPVRHCRMQNGTDLAAQGQASLGTLRASVTPCCLKANCWNLNLLHTFGI